MKVHSDVMRMIPPTLPPAHPSDPDNEKVRLTTVVTPHDPRINSHVSTTRSDSTRHEISTHDTSTTQARQGRTRHDTITTQSDSTQHEINSHGTTHDAVGLDTTRDQHTTRARRSNSHDPRYKYSRRIPRHEMATHDTRHRFRLITRLTKSSRHTTQINSRLTKSSRHVNNVHE